MSLCRKRFHRERFRRSLLYGYLNKATLPIYRQRDKKKVVMKKTIISIILLVMYFLNSYSQKISFGIRGLPALCIRAQDITKYDIIDSSYMNVYYNFFFKLSETEDSLKNGDRMELMIGKNYTKYYSLSMQGIDERAEEIYKKFGWRGKSGGARNIGQTIICNIPQKQLSVINRVPLGNSVNEYEENCPNLKWQLTNETDTILGYICKEATTTFAGRKYIAYYAEDLPIPYGPYKFGGLPGLILEMYDTDEEFYWICKDINLNKEPIKKYKWNYEKTTKKKWQKFDKEIHIHAGNYLASTGNTMNIYDNNDNVTTIGEDWTVYYNPIEKE